MPTKKNHKKAKTLALKNPTSTIIYLFFLLLLILASIAVVQQSQEMRQFAQTPTPTPLLRCGVPCTYNSQCPAGLFCSSGYCRNPMCATAEDCTCTITATPNPNVTHAPVVVRATSTPKPTITPTVNPSPTMYPYATLNPVPTIDTTLVTPPPAFEVTPTTPKKMSLLEAVIQFIGNIFCKLFQAC